MRIVLLWWATQRISFLPIAPPTPRQFAENIRKDLRDIFQKAKAPSPKAAVIALRDIFEKAANLFVFTEPKKELGTKSLELGSEAPPPSPVPSSKPQALSSEPQAPSSVAEVIKVREVIERREVIVPADLSSVALAKEEISSFQRKLDDINSYVLTQFSKVFGDLTLLSSRVDTKTPFTIFAQSQKIDQLNNPTIRDGMTIATGNLNITDGYIAATSAIISGTTDIRSNLTVGGTLIVSGAQTFSGALTLPSFTATSTTATSSIAYGFIAADKGGLVGIGTSSPFAKLSVAGLGTGNNTYAFAVSDSASTTRLVITDGGNVGIGSSTPTSSLLSIENTGTDYTFYATDQAGDTSPFVITNSGNVGIGTSTPVEKLHVSAGGSYSSVRTGQALIMGREGNNDIYLAGNTRSTIGNYAIDGAATLYYADDGFHTWQNAPVGVHGGTITWTERMRLTEAGHLGLGIIAPVNRLTISAAPTETDSDIGLNATSTAGSFTYSWTIGIDRSDNGKFKIASSTALGTSDRLVIDGDGYVGIGTTSPGANFSVNGSILAQTGTSTFGGLISPSLFSTTSLGFYTSSNAAARLLIDTSGNVGIGTAGPGAKLEVKVDSSSATNNALRLSNTAGQAGIGTGLVFYGDITPVNNNLFNSGRIYSAHTSGAYSGSRLTLQSPTGVDTWSDVLTVVNGKVGIGTITPDSNYLATIQSDNADATFPFTTPVTAGSGGNLSIKNANGTVNSHASLILDASTNGWGAVIAGRLDASNAQSIDFYTSSAAALYHRMVIASGGNVGIGTTSPGSLFSVNGSILAQTGTSTFGGLISPSIFSTTSLAFYTSSNAAPRMFVDTSGNVGVGITNPTSTLSIGARVSSVTADPDSINLGGTFSSIAGANPKLILYDDGTNVAGLGISSNRIDYSVINSNWNHVFYQGTTELARIGGGGSVGIGTSTLSLVNGGVSTLLTIDGSSNAGLALSGGTSRQYLLYSGNSSAFNIYDATAGTHRFMLNSSGDVGIGDNFSPVNKLEISGGGFMVRGAEETITGPTSATSPGGLLEGVQIGYDTTNDRAILRSVDWSASFQPLYFQGKEFRWSTGASSLTERAVLNDGAFGFGTTTPGGVLSVSAGTTSPLVLLNQTSTGDLLTLQDSGATVFTVKDGGNVGIGTTGPGALLALNGSFLSQGTSTINGGGLITGGIMATGTLAFYTSGTAAPRAVIDSSGNFGIGTNSPSALFSVAGTAYFNTTAGSNALTVGSSTTQFVIDGIGRIGIATSSPLGRLTVEMDGNTFPSFIVANNGSSTPAFTIGGVNQDGRIGIGTSSPQEQLTMIGGSLFQSGGDGVTSYTPNTLGGVDIGAGVVSRVSGRYAYLVNSLVGGVCTSSDSSGCDFRIYDISTTSPSFVGGMDLGPNGPNNIFVSGNYAFIVKDNNNNTAPEDFVIYDISNPAAIATTSAMSLMSGVEGINSVTEIYVSGKYAYVGGGFVGNDLQIIDISNPSTPVVLGGVDVGGIHDIFVQGRYAYFVTGHRAGVCSSPTFAGCEFLIADISNPVSPVLVGGVDLGGNLSTGEGGASVEVSGPYAYVGKSSAGIVEDFIIYDISNPSAIATTSGIDIGIVFPRSIQVSEVSGRYAYIATEVTGNDFRILDVGDPYNIVTIGGVDFGVTVNTVSVKGRRAYVSLGSVSGNDFRILDLTGIETQSLLAHSLEAGNAQILGSLMVGHGIFSNSLNTGLGGIQSIGPLSVFIASTTQVSPVSASFMGGSVGVGTSSPPARLSVTGRGTVTDWAFLVTDSASTTRFLVRDNGTVGIGTDTPGALLSVNNGSAVIGGVLTAENNIKTSFFVATSTSVNSGIGTTTPGSLFSVNGSILAQTGTSTFGGLISPSVFSTTSLNFYANSNVAPVINIDENNNVGIGTDPFPPVGKLTIYDNSANPILAVNNLLGTGRGNIISIQSNGGTRSYFDRDGSFGYAGSGSSIIQSGAYITINGATASPMVLLNQPTGGAHGDILQIQRGGSTTFTVNNAGLLGVGTDSPSALLSLSAATTVPAFLLNQTSTGDLLTLQDGGSTVFTIKDGGNVGIGTTSPGSLLSINGSILAQTGTSTFGGLISPSLFSTTSLAFYTSSNAAARLLIDTSGRVGIGTTGPSALLSLNGPFLAQGTSTILGGGLNTESLQATGSLAFYTSGTAAPRAVIDSSGNFGIGTNSPSALFSVAGTAYFNTTAGSNALTVGSSTTQFVIDGIGRVGIATSSPLGRLTVEMDGNTYPAFIVANNGSSTPAFTIGGVNQDGRIGIGTSSPQEQLTLIGGSLLQAGGDATNNYTPTLIGSADFGGMIGIDAHRLISVSGRYAYVVGGQAGTSIAGECSALGKIGCEFKIYDISTPTPSLVGGVELGAAAQAIFVSGDLAFVGKTNAGITEDFIIYDVSNPASIATTSGRQGNAGVASIYVSGKYAYFGGDSGANLFIYDISDPRNPVLMSTLNTGTTAGVYAIQVVGKYAYISRAGDASNNEFRIVDISNPVSPAIVGGVELGATSRTLYISYPYAYVGKDNSGITEDFIIYDISNPAAIATTSGLDMATSVTSLHAAGRYMYAGLQTVAGNDLVILDIENPQSIATVGGVDIGLKVSTVFASGRRLYIGTTSGNELRVYDLTGIETQSLLAHSFEAGQAQVRDTLLVGQGIYSNSLNVGLGGIQSTGPLSVFIASTTQVSPISASFMGGSVGVGTSSPPARLSVTGRGTVTDWAFLVADSASTTKFLIQDNGKVGLASSTPWGQLSVELDTTVITGTTTPVFFVGDEGTSTPMFVVSGGAGYVGIGTTSPSQELSIKGDILLSFNEAATTNGVCHSGADIDGTSNGLGVVLVACSAAPGDIAEWYETEQGTEPGDIVATSLNTLSYQTPQVDARTGTLSEDITQTVSVLKKASNSSDSILGIVSTAPYQTFGRAIISSSQNPQPVALAGRVPVKVSLEGGSIQPGDKITLSSQPGIGMKATTSGNTVGIALEPFDGTIQSGLGTSEYSKTGKILVFVNLGYSQLDAPVAELGTKNLELGTNLSSSDLAPSSVNAFSVDQNSGKVSVNFFGDLRLNGNSIVDVKAITGMWGKWSIDENGKVIAKEVETEVLRVTKQAEVGTSEQPAGITIYDRATKQPICVFSENGALRSEAGACAVTDSQQPTTSNTQPTTDNTQSQPTTNNLPLTTEQTSVSTTTETTSATIDTTQSSASAEGSGEPTKTTADTSSETPASAETATQPSSETPASAETATQPSSETPASAETATAGETAGTASTTPAV